jgi:hypothetical protein
MTARTIYEASVKAAAAVKVVTELTNAGTHQTSNNASGCDAGYNLQTGNYANLKTAVDNANKARRAADLLAEQTKQNAIMVAKDLLRDSGDRAPF